MAVSPRSLSVLQDGRDPRGRFASGNVGRPIGAKNKVSRDLLAQVKAMGPAAVGKLWEAVTANERWAVELVLSHVLPAQRTIEFEGASIEDISTALEVGDITPDEAKTLATALSKLRELSDLDIIRAQLDELEKRLVAGN